MNADEIDLSKENIQPLRQGRKTAQLGLALKAQNDKDVQEKMLKERESYELAIITYEGDDPLEPRQDYVKWIEQCCPKFGAESNMIPLLEDTIMLFKDDERYKEDPRFVEIIIKYIESQEHAPELYQIVHSQGLGTKCASLYKSWAECLDACQNLKGADQIYRLGIASHAEPIEVLKGLHAQFQLSVARRMLLGGNTDSTQPSGSAVTERQRTVLGKIGKASAAGSLRHNRGGPGHVNNLLSESRNNTKISVYQEDENDDALWAGVQANKIGTFVNRDEVHKENIMKPHPWNKGFSKKQQRITAPPVPMVPRTPTFQVLKDDDLDDNAEKSKNEHIHHPTPVTASKVLKTRKTEVAQKTPIQLFKSPLVSSAKNNMPKFEVFSGGREYSFEELRLAYYSKHKTYNSDEIGKTPQKEIPLPTMMPSPSCSAKRLVKSLNQVQLFTLVEEEDEEENYAISIEPPTKSVDKYSSSSTGHLLTIRETVPNKTISKDTENDNIVVKETEEVVIPQAVKYDEISTLEDNKPIVEKSVEQVPITSSSYILQEISLNTNSNPSSLSSRRTIKRPDFTVFCD